MRGTTRYSALSLSLLIVLSAAVASCDRPDQKWVSESTGVSIMIPGDHGWKRQQPHGDSKAGVERRARFSAVMVSYQEMPQKGPVTVTQQRGEAWETRYFKRSLGTKVSG